jgi:hypothetical protein
LKVLKEQGWSALLHWSLVMPGSGYPQDGRQRSPALPAPSQQVITQAWPLGQLLFGPQWVSQVVDTAQKRVLLLSAMRVQIHPGLLLQETCCSSAGHTERSRHAPSQPTNPLSQV